MADLFDSFDLAPAPPPNPTGPRLATARLLLRPLVEQDAPAMHRLINDWEICRRLPDAPFPYPASLAAEWIAAAAADRAAGRAQQFGLIEAASGTLVGCAGLRLSHKGAAADLGYWLGRAYWGQGFGQEAAARLVDWGMAELPIAQITATIAADNEASHAILHRNGFRRVGQGEQAFQCRPGVKLPVLHFAIARNAPFSVSAPRANLLLVVACALVDAGGRILLARRPEGKKLAGLWEFPGGKMNPGEVPEAALVRELNEELGITVDPGHVAPFSFASHAYDGVHLLIPLYLCRRWLGQPTAREGQTLAWVAPDRLVEYPMPPADRPFIPMLRDFL